MRTCLGYALLTSQGEATGFRERIGMTIMAGEARRETCKDRVAESASERGEELELSEVQEMCLRNPGDKYDEQDGSTRGRIWRITEKQKEKK